jgi:pimeloyl-ACP methyl ester carboxylesterase
MRRWLVRGMLGSLGLLAILVIAALGLTIAYWAPDRPVDELKARWAPPPSQFLAIDGMSVHLRDEGPRDDPSPLLLLHGTSASLHTWEGWARVLKTRHRVVSVDLPGYGLTGPAPDGDYSPARNTQFIVDLLDTLKIDQAVLAGNSFGGQVALGVALDHPERVQKLILVDALGYPRNATSVPIGFRIAGIPGLNRWLQLILPRSMVESSLRNVYGDPSRVTPALVDRYFDLSTRAGNRAALPTRFRFLPTDASAKRIATISMPTLILWGGRDRLIPPDNAERFHRDIANSRLVMFPALGHVPQEEDPAATVAAVELFL